MADSSQNKPVSSLRPIKLIDLEAQQKRIRDNLNQAISNVLNHGRYIMGPEIAELESQLSIFCGARHAITCSSGTDALLMTLMAIGIGPGDAVICPAFTFTATPEVISMLGATPVLADVRQDTFNLDPARILEAIDLARRAGLTPRAIIPVDLFGQPADYDAIVATAKAQGLFVLCDAAQSFGASVNGRKVGTIGNATATSFFPAKPLGCYGDGGAIFTDDDELAEKLRSLRTHGSGTNKYDIVRIGMNARLDTIQAAVLLEKLKIFPDEIESRNKIAARYSVELSNVCGTPTLIKGAVSTWAQYTIKVPAHTREGFRGKLSQSNVPTAIYYPRPVHLQPAHSDRCVLPASLSVSQTICEQVVSIPMHPYLTSSEQFHIISTTKHALTEVYNAHKG